MHRRHRAHDERIVSEGQRPTIDLLLRVKSGWYAAPLQHFVDDALLESKRTASLSLQKCGAERHGTPRCKSNVRMNALSLTTQGSGVRGRCARLSSREV